MSIIKYVTLQKIVAHDFRYDPRIFIYIYVCVYIYIYVLLTVSQSQHSCLVLYYLYIEHNSATGVIIRCQNNKNKENKFDSA